MSSTAAVKRKKMKHYSVGSIIWIIVERSIIFFRKTVWAQMCFLMMRTGQHIN